MLRRLTRLLSVLRWLPGFLPVLGWLAGLLAGLGLAVLRRLAGLLAVVRGLARFLTVLRWLYVLRSLAVVRWLAGFLAELRRLTRLLLRLRVLSRVWLPLRILRRWLLEVLLRWERLALLGVLRWLLVIRILGWGTHLLLFLTRRQDLTRSEEKLMPLSGCLLCVFWSYRHRYLSCESNHNRASVHTDVMFGRYS